MTTASSQQLPHYSLSMFNNTILNPAALSQETQNQIVLMTRSQWLGFEGAPQTHSASYYNVNHLKYGRGISILSDKTGPISSFRANLGGSYILPLEEHRNKLSVGLSASILQFQIDNSLINLESDGVWDPVMELGIEKTLAHSVTLGSHYYNDDFYLGFALANLFTGELEVGSKNKLVNHYYLSGGYSFGIGSSYAISPSVLFKKTDPTDLQMDLTTTVSYQDLLSLGLTYRTSDAMVLMLGVNFKEYTLAYSYDITTSSMRIPSNGSHGLMLSYSFDKIEKDYDKDGVIDKEDECPKIKGSIGLKGCPDRDGDGIADKEDECPDDPGLKIHKGCPDRDGDGVIDKKDRCPDIPGIQELDGCPDRDGDGLQDALDKCPDEKGSIKNLGCPEEKEPSIDTLEYVFQNLQFDFNKSILTFSSQNLLDLAGKYLANHPTMIIRIIGHTDHIGSHRYNMKLSKDRAQAAKRYLVKYGIKKGRIEVTWKGKTEPIDDSGTDKAREINRRVEFKILEW